jgi:hypothetical protein
MPKLSDVPQAIREMLCAHESFRKLGFASEDIYVDKGEDQMTRIVLKAQGQQFVCLCGWLKPAMTWDEFAEAWNTAAANVNGGAYHEEELSKMYEQSFIYRNRRLLVEALTMKGFKFPRSDN